MATFEQCVEELHGLIEECVSRTESFRYDHGNVQHCAAVALLGTVLELARDLIPLFRKRSSASPKVILRSLMEARIDLRNIVDDASYLKNMQAAQLEQNARAFRESSKPEAVGNPYFRTLRSSGAARAIEIAEELKGLNEEGFRKLTIRDRFERAGEGHRYTVIYHLLSVDAHHNLTALERRHAVGDQGSPTITFFKPEDLSTLTLEVAEVAFAVANALADVSRLLDGEVRDVEQVRDRFEAVGGNTSALLSELADEEE